MEPTVLRYAVSLLFGSCKERGMPHWLSGKRPNGGIHLVPNTKGQQQVWHYNMSLYCVRISNEGENGFTNFFPTDHLPSIFWSFHPHLWSFFSHHPGFFSFYHHLLPQWSTSACFMGPSSSPAKTTQIRHYDLRDHHLPGTRMMEMVKAKTWCIFSSF